ncbi:unnamed protein product [Camellia sinensis]
MWGSPYKKTWNVGKPICEEGGNSPQSLGHTLGVHMTNKSQFLLQNYSPVHKRVPVLVHGEKPNAESLVVLEYIDEIWTNAPKLLPEDPYKRAKVRFWANFLDQW